MASQNTTKIVLNVTDATVPFSFSSIVSAGTYTVDWGDGSVDSTSYHTYAATGNYVVSISGPVTGIYVTDPTFDAEVPPCAEFVTAINQYGFNVTAVCFQGCANLTTVPGWNNVTDATLAYAGCTSLSSVPPWPRGGLNALGAFMGCSGITEIPRYTEGFTGILDMAFAESGITAIPKWPTGRVQIQDLFLGCTAITKTFSYRTDLLMTDTLNRIDAVVVSEASNFAKSLFRTDWGGSRTVTSRGIDLECAVPDATATAKIVQNGPVPDSQRDSSYEYTVATNGGCVFEPGDTVEITVSESSYPFLGWQKVDAEGESDDSEDDNDLVAERTIRLTLENNVTYRAVFEINRTIIYSANLSSYTGTPPSSLTISNSGDQIVIASNTFGSSYRTFREWNTAADGSGFSFQPGESVTLGDFGDDTGNTITLYAQWDGTTFSLTLDTNGGDALPPDENLTSYEYGISVLLPSPTRTGYRFIGWTDEQEGGKVYDYISETHTGDLVLYAQWGSNLYSVKFLDYLGNVLSAQTVAANGYAIAPSVPTRSGYTFSGWEVDGVEADPAETSITEDTTFQAVYSSKSFYIQTVAKGNGTVDSSPTGSPTGIFQYGQVITLTAQPINANYRFVSWEDGSTNATRTITVVGAATFIATFVGIDMPLTVKSSNEDWGAALGSGTYPYGSNVEISANPFPGYKFAGWESLSGDDRLKTPLIVTVGVISSYYANFSPITYQITARPNDSTMGDVSISGANSLMPQPYGKVTATAQYGTVLTLSATPSGTAYRFVRWSDGSIYATRTVTVTSSADFVAIFAQVGTADPQATPPSPSHTTLARKSWTDADGTLHINDIYLHGGERDANGNLINSDGPLGDFAIVSGKEAYAQIVDAVVKTRLGELILDTERGIPYIEGAFLDSAGRNEWASAMRNSVEELDFVTGIQDFTWEVANGTITYSMTITTDDGTIQVDNQTT